MKWRVKLQVVKRKDGRPMYTIYLPKELVERLGWTKGEELFIEPAIIDVNTRNGREWMGLLIVNPRDCYAVLPEKYCRERLRLFI